MEKNEHKSKPNNTTGSPAVNKRRNRKRNKSNQSNKKVENLISKTFQEKIQSLNNHQSEKPDNSTTTVQDTNNLMPMEKSREEIMAARAAKKAAKGKPQSPPNKVESKPEIVKKSSNTDLVVKLQNSIQASEKVEKSREEVLAEREAKKLAKQAAKKPDAKTNQRSQIAKSTNSADNKNEENLANNIEKLKISSQTAEKKPALTKAERRALQEAQRAAKAEKLVEKKPLKNIETPLVQVKKPVKITPDKSKAEKLSSTNSNINEYKIKLFNHLDGNFNEKNLFINNTQIHPAMVRLGEQYEKRTVVGSNARCIAFLSALKMVIKDYETPPKKEFARGLEATIKNCVDHLHKCRPLAVSVTNAHKCIKLILTQLPPDKPEIELKAHICEYIDIYIKDQIEKAALAISSTVQEKISNGDVILTFGCSSLINHILEEAHSRKIDFRVIVVDSRPFLEGQELLRRLVSKQISCTYVLINAIGFVMPDVTKVLMGAHALLANGYVMARTGTAQVALVARSFNVPVLVCCETHKFSERVQTDAIVFNELGNPNDLVNSNVCKLANWQSSNSRLTPLNLNYDITPPELVTAVVTEVAILPCTSVPVILRLRPTEIGY